VQTTNKIDGAKMDASKIDAALAYASWGWHVLPVVPNGKTPATAHGVHDATTDAEQIKAWWTQNPNFNIGIAAGNKSGIVVFDIDPRNGGDTSWQGWIAEHGAPQDCAMALTAGGGQHYIAAYQPGVRSCKLREGIDLLSDGRYFVAHPSSVEGKSYEWEASSDPFDGVAPGAIPSAWTPHLTQRKTSTSVSSGELIQGNRNAGLTSLAGSMRNFGMSEAEILAAISIANETRCEIPLPSSEIAQIARSVARYEPDHDVAASTALGDEAAEAILSAYQAQQTSDYYLTRATSFLGQPAPLPWVIKGWLPAYGTCMIYGESGVGKTFVALDMACSIASAMMWQGIKTKPGIVVYLAGEGNYGMRQRIAAWCAKHGIAQLDNLLISNKAIDLDSPGAAARIIAAVREMTGETVVLVIIDTLNNHMSGDENSAKDTRAMINACNIVSTALGATSMLVHHLGHSSESKQRARGSSAWRGALDASILVSGETNEIKISCTKMKDATEPEEKYGWLEPVNLGWVDEDGLPINGAVFSFFSDGDLRIPQPKSTKLDGHKKSLERAWFVGCTELVDGLPYISRDTLKTFLLEQGIKPGSVESYLKTSGREGMIVRDLMDAKIIRKEGKGWVVIDRDFGNELLLKI
jgi:hypothetical protein